MPATAGAQAPSLPRRSFSLGLDALADGIASSPKTVIAVIATKPCRLISASTEKSAHWWLTGVWESAGRRADAPVAREVTGSRPRRMGSGRVSGLGGQADREIPPESQPPCRPSQPPPPSSPAPSFPPDRGVRETDKEPADPRMAPAKVPNLKKGSPCFACSSILASLPRRGLVGERPIQRTGTGMSSSADRLRVAPGGGSGGS